MSLLPASSSGEVSTGFYNGIVEQSSRFRQPDSSYLYRNNSSDGNRKTMSFSWWYKKGQSTIGSYNIGEFFNHGGAGAGGTQSSARITLESNKFNLAHEDNNSTSWELISNALFRDHTNFYHFFVAIDTTQSTASNRVRVYVNGTEITDWGTSTYPSQDASLRFGQAKHYIGVSEASGNPWSATYLDGYMCDVIYIDGTALTPSSFGEFKNGVWVAKAYTGSYGTNGHRLEFKNTTSGGASPSSSTIGADTSGNNNHYNDYNFSSHDSNLPDSPENNFATALAGLAEPQDYQSYYKGTYSEGNLKVTGSSSGWTNGSSNFGVTSGKWYAECRIGGKAGTGYIRFGVRSRPARTYDEYFWNDDGTGQVDGTTSPYSGRVGTYGAGDILMVALDLENNAIYFGKNGTWENSATSSEIAAGTTTNAYVASTTIVPTGDDNEGHAYFFYCQPHSTGSNITWNFGQDSSFAGAETAQGNSDSGNSTTDFYYTPPTGFLACNTVNLPDITLSPDQDEQADDHFNTVLYDGDGNSTNDITGVGFKPDWTWIKERQSDGSHIANHVLVDSSRGYENFLVSASSQAESSGVTGNNSTRSNDGFQTTNSGATNQSGQPYVAWNWRLNGGTTSSDTNGNRTSAVQVNSTAGISIATFTNTSGNFSFGHGLGSKPEAFIWKARNAVMNWIWWDSHNFTVPDADGQYFNSNIGFNTGSNWLTGLTDTTISITDGLVSSGSNVDYWCISFKSVEGFSKINNYTGNGSTDGTFVYTGFRPAWVLIKGIGTTSNGWYIYSNKIEDFGTLIDGQIYVNLSNAVDTGNRDLDFLSNGFKPRLTDTNVNGSGTTYVYMAFAEQPFKFSNAR